MIIFESFLTTFEANILIKSAEKVSKIGSSKKPNYQNQVLPAHIRETLSTRQNNWNVFQFSFQTFWRKKVLSPPSWNIWAKLINNSSSTSWRRQQGERETTPENTQTHTHALSLSLSNTHTLSMSLCLSHTCTHTHYFSLSHTHTHTHTNRRTETANLAAIFVLSNYSGIRTRERERNKEK